MRGKDKGDPSTVAGEFPGDLGGGGGGGGRSGPIQIMEDPAISRSLGGDTRGYGMVGMDNRRIGGSLYGVYYHDTDFPFKGGTYTYTEQVTGTNGISFYSDLTISASEGNNLMGAMAYVGLTNGSVGAINRMSLGAFSWSMTQDFFSPAINSYNQMMFLEMSGLNVPTGERARFSVNIPFMFPALYYEYNLPEGIEAPGGDADEPYLFVRANRTGINNDNVFMGQRRKRFVFPGSVASIYPFVQFYMTTQGGEEATFDGTMTVEFASADPAPNLTPVDYPTYTT